MPRETPYASLMPQFLNRTSSRAISTEALPRETIETLLEAARWTPSCYNEQPWLFAVATGPSSLETFRNVLVDANRNWADAAPVLILCFSRNRFTQNDKENAWAAFDTGSAWMSLALQAHHMGLVAHAMAGFHAAKAYEVTGFSPDDVTARCAIAIGKPGDKAILSKELQAGEALSDRNPLKTIAHFF